MSDTSTDTKITSQKTGAQRFKSQNVVFSGLTKRRKHQKWLSIRKVFHPLISNVLVFGPFSQIHFPFGLFYGKSHNFPLNSNF